MRSGVGFSRPSTPLDTDALAQSRGLQRRGRGGLRRGRHGFFSSPTLQLLHPDVVEAHGASLDALEHDLPRAGLQVHRLEVHIENTQRV